MSKITAPPKPMRVTARTVTIDRALWDAYIERLEDAEDLAALDAYDGHVAAIGQAEAKRLCYTMAESERMTDGVSAVCIWRERAGLSQRDLAEMAKVSPSYLAEIEAGKKPGSAAALSRLAAVLHVPMDMLVRTPAAE